MADRAAHFQLQYLEGFFSLKAFLEKVFLGSRRGGGVYTVPEVKGYPGEELLNSGVLPEDVLKRKCLQGEGTGSEQPQSALLYTFTCESRVHLPQQSCTTFKANVETEQLPLRMMLTI